MGEVIPLFGDRQPTVADEQWEVTEEFAASVADLTHRLDGLLDEDQTVNQLRDAVSEFKDIVSRWEP